MNNIIETSKSALLFLKNSLMPKKIVLWLDDTRDPFSEEWNKYIRNNIYGNPYIYHAINFGEFEYWITQGLNKMPDFIAFDNDLGAKDGKDGLDCAKFLVNYCQDNNIKLPSWHIQSMNIPAKISIDSLLKNYGRIVEGKESC